jgi:DNA-binding CsgD family transcriptional regulator
VSAPDQLALLSEKMDTLIRIQAALAIKDMDTQREKIVFLYGTGLGPNYIASLLGLKPKTVSSEMAKHKRAVSGKGDVSDE